MTSIAERRTYSRPVGPADWLQLARPAGWQTDIQLCVEGEGTIDPSALSAAVATASQACPGMRVVRRGRLWVDSGVSPAVRMVKAADSGRTWLDSPLLRTPLQHKESPWCEVVMVSGSPATVVFRAHHAVTDGLGAIFWQKQVFRALRGEPVEGAASRLDVDEVKAQIAAGLGAELTMTPPRAVRWRPLLGQLPTGPSRPMRRRRTIDGTHPSAVAKIARQVVAFGDRGGEGTIAVPVDLRQFLPGLRSTATATGMVFVQVRSEDDWNDVQASLLSAMSEHQHLSGRCDPAVLQVPLAELRARHTRLDTAVRADNELLNEKKLCQAIASVSHVGGIDLADLCADGFEATSFYSLGGITWLPQVDVSESGGRTEITISRLDGPGVAERAEALLDSIEEDLSPRRYRAWDGNRTDRAAPPDTLTSLFAEQVRRTPNAVAISGADGDTSYAELSQRADAIAAALRSRGAGRGDRIGLIAGRSAAAITAIWGILKAGAAYLPIDSSYPDARITQILTHAAAPACLLEPPNHQRDCLPAGCEPISLATVPHTGPPGWRDADIRPGDLANVIYTSGSTGTPKGVEIEHRSMVNFARWVTREAGIDASAKMPLVASLSFDITGFAVFLPLLAGGTVLPVREVNAVTLREVIEDSGANVISLTSSHLDLINQAGIRRSTMRVVMAGGELLRRSTALRALEVFGPQCRILCQWGPTETTIVNTSHEFDPETDTDAGVPFGRPMDNNTVHLLDANGRFVPPGEPGEAYVGGIQVARGYLGRPDLTRQRFVRLADGTRVYRTGDIARLLPNGELAFISRADDQVKVAGHRIEPAEIAQALEHHPHVRQAAVIPRTRPGHHDKELCAYVVCDPAATPGDLRDFLTGQLPRYMIPAAILPVPDIPRNANGKTDARQLPDPFTTTTPEPRDTPAGHDDDVTAAVAAIWARTLNASTSLITEHADFHQLGGNSIMLLTMVNEVSQTIVQHRQDEFMNQLRHIIREPTLRRTSDLARQARDGRLTLGRCQCEPGQGQTRTPDPSPPATG